MAVAQKYKVTYIDLFEYPEYDPFATQPNVYYAADGFHPSADGYAYWFERVQPVISRLFEAN